VVRTELNLTGEIEDNVSILSQSFQFLIQPVKVLVKVFHAVQHSSVRTEAVRVHDILEGDQGRDVDRAGVWDVVVRRVKVHDGYRSVKGSEELVFAVAVGRFATAWRTDNDFAERHMSGRRLGDYEVSHGRAQIPYPQLPLLKSEPPGATSGGFGTKENLYFTLHTIATAIATTANLLTNDTARGIGQLH